MQYRQLVNRGTTYIMLANVPIKYFGVRDWSLITGRGAGGYKTGGGCM